MRWAVAVLVCAIVLAGCGQRPASTQSDGSGTAVSWTHAIPTTSHFEEPGFDGAAAFGFVRGLVEADGQPRFRVPGTPSHTEAALWLHDAMQVDGWTVAWHNFTGADYQAMPKGGVASYTQDCTQEETERVAGLRFANLVATWDAGDTDRTFALGAHWESKREASSDPDPAKRSQPVLGANDGASGVGVLLQLMRHLAQQGSTPGVDLMVVLFDGEDGFEDCHPLAGSIAFVQGLEPGAVDRMLLLDMVGDRDARFVRELHGCDPGMEALFARHAPRVGLEGNFVHHQRAIADDHLPFVEAGIPASDLLDAGRPTYFPPYWHTTRDTMENLDARMLGRVGELLLAAMADPDFTGQWPETCEG